MGGINIAIKAKTFKELLKKMGKGLSAHLTNKNLELEIYPYGLFWVGEIRIKYKRKTKEWIAYTRFEK